MAGIPPRATTKDNAMKLIRFSIIAAGAVLAGCVSDDATINGGEEFLLPEMQQNTYLSHAKMPQHFGFQVYAVKDGVAMSGEARLHPNHLATAKILKGSVPVIELEGRANRFKLNALIDPSSPSTWMEFGKAQEFEAKFLGVDEVAIPYRGGYNTGGASAYAAVVSQFRIDQLFMENIPLYVRMALNSLGPLARGVKVPNVDMIMGWDMIKTFEYVQFDFDAQAIQFSSSIPYVPHQDLLMTTARIQKQPGFGLAVEGAIFGQSTPILLDFAGAYHFARGDVKVSQTKQVSLGEVVYRKVPTMLLPPNSSPPRAGRLMLEKYIITVCPRLGVVYFERVPM